MPLAARRPKCKFSEQKRLERQYCAQAREAQSVAHFMLTDPHSSGRGAR